MRDRAADLERADADFLAANEKLRFFPLTAVSGTGCTIHSADGRHLLDLSSGWTAAGLGYGHPAVTDAVARAIATQPFTGGISAICPDTVALARLLASLATEIPDPRVYLGNCGTDANDVALRACRAYTGRHRFVAFENGYHGGFGLAMAVSGVHVASGATPEAGTVFLPYPNAHRTYSDTEGNSVSSIIARLNDVLLGGDVAAVIVEPIQSDGGVVIPPQGFVSRVIDVARAHAVPVIVDEVKVGLGRTGQFFDFRHDGARPDIVTLGKALGGGLPLSAAIGPASILGCAPASALLTTAGNPVCAAAGLAVVKAILSDALPARAAAAGERFRRALKREVQSIGVDDLVRIRGRGLTIGVDLVPDPSTGEGNRELARKVVYRAWQLGAVVFYVGGHVLEVTPALTITDQQIDNGAAILARSIGDACAGLVSDDDIAPFAGW